MLAIYILIASLSSCLIIIKAETIQAQAQSYSLYDVSIFSSAALPNYLPNIEYLGQGYNIFFGNPHSTTGWDSGFKNQLLIEYEYEEGRVNSSSLSADKRWIVPKGVKFSSYQSCSTSYSSKEVSTMKEYSQSLQAGVNVGGRFLGASFSASADYKQVEKTLSSGDSIFVESHAKCVLFDVGLYLHKKAQNLKFKSVFVRKLKKLASQNSKEDYFAFFDEYGTHMTTQVKLGSKFGYRFEMKKSIQNNSKLQGVSVAASASFYCVSANFNTDVEKSASEAFREDLQSWESFSFGAPPDPNNDVAKWASQAITNSLPVQMNLVPYEDVIDFITPQNSGNDENLKLKLEEAEKIKLKTSFMIQLQKYCLKLKLQNCKYSFENVQIEDEEFGKSLGFDEKTNEPMLIAYDGRDIFEFDLIPTQKNLYWIMSKKKQACLKYNMREFALCKAGDDSLLFQLGFKVENEMYRASITSFKDNTNICQNSKNNGDFRYAVNSNAQCMFKIKEITPQIQKQGIIDSLKKQYKKPLPKELRDVLLFEKVYIQDEEFGKSLGFDEVTNEPMLIDYDGTSIFEFDLIPTQSNLHWIMNKKKQACLKYNMRGFALCKAGDDSLLFQLGFKVENEMYRTSITSYKDNTNICSNSKNNGDFRYAVNSNIQCMFKISAI